MHRRHKERSATFTTRTAFVNARLRTYGATRLVERRGRHLINMKKVVKSRNVNMQWFKVRPKSISRKTRNPIFSENA